MPDQKEGIKGIFEQFVEAISGVIPLLDNIKNTITESSGRIPKASRQLHSVSEATESATVEILNVLDSMSQKIGKVEAGVTAVKKNQEHQAEAARKVTELVASAGNPSLVRAWEIFQKSVIQAEAIAVIERFLTEIKEDSMNIAMALQVQDITSQQIAGATHMIESVRLELIRILDHFDGDWTNQSPPQRSPAPDPPSPQPFDTDAQFTNATVRQERADAIVKQWNGTDHAADL